jgi:hypothetical protein
MKGITIESEPVGVYLYDIGIDDITERREKRIYFDSSRKAALFLGINYNKVIVFIREKKRVVGRDGKIYAVRHASESKTNS